MRNQKSMNLIFFLILSAAIIFFTVNYPEFIFLISWNKPKLCTKYYNRQNIEVEDIKIEIEDQVPRILIQKASIKEIPQTPQNVNTDGNTMLVPSPKRINFISVPENKTPKYDSSKSFEEATALILDHRK